MGDITMGLVVLGFFFVCICYVSWCGRIIGPDPDERETESTLRDSVAKDR